MRTLLRLRAWQVFALLVAVPLAADMALFLAFDSLHHGVLMSLMAVSIASYAALLFAWIWSVGVGVNATLPDGKRWKTGCFTAATAYAVAYVASSLAIYSVIRRWWPALVSLHVCAMLATLYAECFVTRTLVINRCGNLRVLPTIGIFLLLSFLPLGVWVIQPWANRAAADLADRQCSRRAANELE